MFSTFPSITGLLSCNSFDTFAIKTCLYRKTFGHLSREISGITKFIIDCGSEVTSGLSGTRYLRSPIVQGRLEIPCAVKVKVSTTVIHLLLQRHTNLVQYIEPKEEIFLESFLRPQQTPGERVPAERIQSGSSFLHQKKEGNHKTEIRMVMALTIIVTM